MTSPADVLLTYAHLRGPYFDAALFLVEAHPPAEQVAAAIRIGKATRPTDGSEPAPLVVDEGLKDDDPSSYGRIPPRWWRIVSTVAGYAMAATIVVAVLLVLFAVCAALGRWAAASLLGG